MTTHYKAGDLVTITITGKVERARGDSVVVYAHGVEIPVLASQVNALDHVDECMKLLGISLNLLDPKSALGRPASALEQMMIHETVKGDYQKLLDALATLQGKP